MVTKSTGNVNFSNHDIKCHENVFLMKIKSSTSLQIQINQCTLYSIVIGMDTNQYTIQYSEYW